MSATGSTHAALAILALTLLQSGCGNHALLNIAAADSMEALAAQTRRALDEYRHDLDVADDAREAEVIAAFVRRVRTDAADDATVEAHGGAFRAALSRLRTDRETAWRRHSAASDNVARIEEIAGGLRRLAVQSMSLGDEWQRFVGNLIEARRRAAQSQPPRDAAAPLRSADP